MLAAPGCCLHPVLVPHSWLCVPLCPFPEAAGTGPPPHGISMGLCPVPALLGVWGHEGTLRQCCGVCPRWGQLPPLLSATPAGHPKPGRQCVGCPVCVCGARAQGIPYKALGCGVPLAWGWNRGHPCHASGSDPSPSLASAGHNGAEMGSLPFPGGPADGERSPRPSCPPQGAGAGLCRDKSPLAQGAAPALLPHFGQRVPGWRDKGQTPGGGGAQGRVPANRARCPAEAEL